MERLLIMLLWAIMILAEDIICSTAEIEYWSPVHHYKHLSGSLIIKTSKCWWDGAHNIRLARWNYGTASLKWLLSYTHSMRWIPIKENVDHIRLERQVECQRVFVEDTVTYVEQIPRDSCHAKQTRMLSWCWERRRFTRFKNDIAVSYGRQCDHKPSGSKHDNAIKYSSLTLSFSLMCMQCIFISTGMSSYLWTTERSLSAERNRQVATGAMKIKINCISIHFHNHPIPITPRGNLCHDS